MLKTSDKLREPGSGYKQEDLAANPGVSQSHDCHMISAARVAVLFSGGIDSAVLAALADRYAERYIINFR